MKLDEALDDGQAESEPTGGTMKLLPLLREHVEDARQHLRRNADASISDSKIDQRSIEIRADLNPSLRFRVLGRIGQDVRDNLRQSRDITEDNQSLSHAHCELMTSLFEQRMRAPISPPPCNQESVERCGSLKSLSWDTGGASAQISIARDVPHDGRPMAAPFRPVKTLSCRD